jgi:hypothetical protein
MGAVCALRADGRTLAGSFVMQDVWLSAELCKIRNPPDPQPWWLSQSRSLERLRARNIVSRNNISRYECARQ